ncbi:hypothetical protein [Streptomyces fradiae]|uniref:hypothetical protein n=1 Tax=Streptomyces fradiae TaxID=1906 RepID=UPI0035BE78F2
MSKTKSIALLSAGHACVDVHQGAVAALVPFFVAERGYGSLREPAAPRAAADIGPAPGQAAPGQAATGRPGPGQAATGP